MRGVRGAYAVELADMDAGKVFARGTVVADDDRRAVLVLAQMAGLSLEICGRAMTAGEDWACELGQIGIAFCVSKISR